MPSADRDLQHVVPEVWWRLDTRWACGAVVTRNGVVVEAAPIYRCFIGQRIQDVAARGRYTLSQLALDSKQSPPPQ